jgi:hypothetical protein
MHWYFAFHFLHVIFGALILSFFVLFAASKAEGLVSIFGNILGLALLVIGVLAIVGVVMMHFGGDKGREWMEHMHQGGAWGPPAMHQDEAAPAQPAPPPKTVPITPTKP